MDVQDFELEELSDPAAKLILLMKSGNQFNFLQNPTCPYLIRKLFKPLIMCYNNPLVV